MLVCALALGGCSTGSTSKPTAPSISLILSPASASLFLGQSQTFQATVTGTLNASVTWQVNGIAGGNATLGEISANGAYVAPGTMPSPASLTITAVSSADSAASASATVTLKDDIAVTVSPSNANVPTGGEQVFSASIAASGSPTPGVTWSVNSIVGGNEMLGTIVANGADTAIYTAPAVQPTPASVTIGATSLADSTKTGTGSANVTCAATGATSPPSSTVALAASQSLTASFCLAAVATIAWDANGTAGGDATDGTIATTGANSALYTAPPDLPANTTVSIHATASGVTSGADVASASITVTSGVSVSIAPPSAIVTTGQRVSFAANVSGSSDAAVTWSVDGATNGNAAVGQICVSGSNPCSPPAVPLAGSIDFLAPTQMPSPSAVTLRATSRADASQSGTATVTISAPAPVSVTIAPQYMFLPPSSSQPDTQQFYATVSGSANANVTWSVQSAVNGIGCSASACGSISASGLYTAPTGAPSPNAIAITATSQAGNTKNATAIVVISSGPTIETILPSSAMAGAVEGFPLVVRGVNFIAGSGTGASVILVNGVPRATTCATAGSCAIALEPSDLTSAATLTIEVQNPGTPGAISNPVPFVIVPFDISSGTISLTSNAPKAGESDIMVTDPTTAATRLVDVTNIKRKVYVRRSFATSEAP